MARKEYRARHKAQGLCLNCPRKAVTGLLLCEYHMAKNKEYCKKYQPATFKKREDTGRCKRCGIRKHPEMDKGYKTCLNCREELTERRTVEGF